MTLRLMTMVPAPLALLLAAEPAFSTPPAEAKPLSEIVRMREDGGKVEVRVDPLSGQPKR